MKIFTAYLKTGVEIKVPCITAALKSVWVVASGSNGMDAARFRVDEISGWTLTDGEPVGEAVDPTKFTTVVNVEALAKQ